jgi:FkbM family methyltransferase
VDIGANIGYYALMEARLAGPRGRVYAIEPVVQNVKMLMENIILNKYDNIEVYQSAIGASNGTLPMYISDHPNWGSLYRSKSSAEAVDRIDVSVATLDSFMKDKMQPNVIRMDVEGYEYEILKGMADILRSNAPLRLFIEFHPDIMVREDADGFIFGLKDYGFKLRTSIIEPNIYPPYSKLTWLIIDFLNARKLKLRYGVLDMSLDELLANEAIMSGFAGAPALFLER